MHETRSRLLRFGVAVLSTGLALLARLALEPALGDRQPFFVFYAAVVVTAWYAGAGPALLALGLSYLLTDWFLVSPYRVFSPPAPATLTGALTFFAVGLVIVLLVERMRSARRAAEAAVEALWHSEEHFRTLADSAPVLIWMSGPDKEGVYFNRPWLEFTGRLLEQELGAGWLESIHPEDRETSLGVCAAAFRERQPFRTQFRLRRADGEHRWVLDTGVPRFAPDGTFLGYVGSCVDITDRMLAEEGLRRSEKLFRAMFEVSASGLVLTDPATGRYLRVNHKFCEITGYSAAELLNLSFPELTHPDDREQDLRQYGRLVRGEVPEYTVEKRYVRKDGRVIWIVVNCVVTRDATGRPEYDVAVVHDVTERRRAEEALRESDRRKDEFLAMLSHELRNPLAAVSNALAVLRLQSGEETPHVHEMAERQLHNLTRLVDDLLDVSRLNRGKLTIRLEPLELADVACRAVEAIRPQAAARGLELSVALPEAPAPVRGDPTRLEQVLTNLLNNACKFTEPGGHVGLSVTREAAAAVVRVRDTGIGMDEATLARAFDLFSQGDRSLDRSQAGLGIGLTLVKSLAEMHGGGVAARSDGPGRGSEFVVSLPVAEFRLPSPNENGSRPEDRHPASEPRQPRRILVVDDNRDAADSLALLLRLDGHEVRVEYDGPAALASAFTFSPEVVLLDIGLPGMDGYEVARRLRGEPSGASALVVAVSGYGADADRARARQAGFDHHLTKPVEPETVRAVLAGPELQVHSGHGQ